MQKWEYTTLTQDGDDLYQDGQKIASGGSWSWTQYLNALGDQGWELVSTSAVMRSYRVNTLTFWVRGFLKRPKQ